MRQLKRAISNWAQYKANCRSMASGNSRQTCFTMSNSSHRSRYSRNRNSAPSTPNMSKILDSVTTCQSFTHSLRKTITINSHKREEPSKLIKDKSCSISDDVNYVIPIFADNEEIGETSDTDYDYRKTYERCDPQVNSSDEQSFEKCEPNDSNVGNAYMEVIAT
jgi:hypothetical protein